MLVLPPWSPGVSMTPNTTVHIYLENDLKNNKGPLGMGVNRVLRTRVFFFIERSMRKRQHSPSRCDFREEVHFLPEAHTNLCNF